MSQGACPMLKGLTKELPSDSLRATRSRNRHEFISDARTAFSMRVWRTVQPPTPPASLPVIVWAMGVGWKQQRSFQPHVLCSTILISRIQFANSRNLNSNSTYHPTRHGSPVGRDRGEPLLQCVTSHNGGVLAPLLPLWGVSRRACH